MVCRRSSSSGRSSARRARRGPPISGAARARAAARRVAVDRRERGGRADVVPRRRNHAETLRRAGARAGRPFYPPTGGECALFEHAFRNRLPLLLKGPTGCGKTRFVAHMAARLGRPLHTVACHDDLTAADLTGRYLLKGGDTVWVDGPLTRAVREGAICYLDEVVEARKDVTVVLHPLTDDRRILPLERTGEVLEAPPEFMLVVSYNPGYQNVLKSLKPQHAPALPRARVRLPAARGRGGDRRAARAACRRTAACRWCGWRTRCAS